ncbi:MAG: hypothetical protein RL375_2524, partial [Pseudomonadota bacterium]
MNQKFGFEARIRAAFGLAVLVVASLTALTWVMARDANEATRRVALSHDLLTDLLRVRTYTVEIELGNRSYRVAGDPAHLAERDVALQAREDLLEHLRQQFRDDPAQQAHWLQLRQVVDERLRLSAQLAAPGREPGQVQDDANTTAVPLAQTRSRLYNLLRHMEEEQQRQLQAQDEQERTARRHMVTAGAAASLTLLLMLAGTYGLFRRQLREAEAADRLAEASTTEHNRQLEQRVVDRTAQLRDSQAHLRSVIDSVPALLAFVDNQQRYVYVNARYLERFAPGQTDIGGRTVREVLGEARYAIAGPLIDKVLHGEPQNYDWQPFDGVWQAMSYHPKLDDRGQVAGYFVLGTDITERRRIEQALRDGEQRLARVLEGSDQGYWDWDLVSNTFRVSPRWETMLGFEAGEMQVDPQSWPRLVHPDDLAEALASIERHRAGLAPGHEAEIRMRGKDGRWRWILTRGSIVGRGDDGTPLVMSGTHTDITERKQFELAQREASIVFENSYEGIVVTDPAGHISKV